MPVFNKATSVRRGASEVSEVRVAGDYAWSKTIGMRNLLFGAGQQGVMYVPKPEVDGQQVLYQDAAGTVPVTADGDPVGYMADLSGNGNHATQSTSAERPVYRTDGVLHWLQGDGVDDFLDTGIWTLDEFWFVSYAISQAAYAQYHGPWRFLIEGGSPTARTTNRLEDYTRDTPDRAILSRTGGVGEGSNREGVLPAAGTKYVGWAGYNPNASHHVGEQWDGNQQQVTVSDLIRSPGTGSLSLFRGYEGDNMPGNYYGMVFMTGTPMGDDDRELVNAYMRDRGGIQL